VPTGLRAHLLPGPLPLHRFQEALRRGGNMVSMTMTSAIRRQLLDCYAFGSISPRLYIFALCFEGWGRLAPMAVKLVDCLASLVAAR
jgi:hypothetical protein